MNSNLFLNELKRNLLSLIVWTGVIMIFISVTMAVYPVFIKNQSKIIGMMNLIPNELLQFKGISNMNDFLSVMGFYAINNIIYMMVLGSIYSIVLASGILLKEEFNKTAEYLLSRPVTRSEVFLSKLALLDLNVILLNLLTASAGFICLKLVGGEGFSIRPFLILSLYTLLLNILFGAIGLFISTIVKRPKPVTALSIGIVLVFYFIFTLSKITESISEIGYLSPFRYVDTNATSPAYTIDLWHLIYFIGISLLLTGSSYLIYRRKDIYT